MKGFHNSVPPRHLLKPQPTLNKAIVAPEAADECRGLEVIDNMEDKSIPYILGIAGYYANLSGCWQSIYSAGRQGCCLTNPTEA
jgi:hypothetical protein